MMRFKKVLSIKIISLAVAVSFLLNSTVYGINLPNKSHLRVPLATAYNHEVVAGIQARLHKEQQVADVQRIYLLVEKLAEQSIFPSLEGKRLIDIKITDPGKLVEFIVDNSILCVVSDIVAILEAKYSSLIDNKNKSVPEDLLTLYSIIFQTGYSGKYCHNNLITVFSGGTGSNHVTKGLLENPVNVSLLVNAYDDGKSTGLIRKNFAMLGPSDMSKNIVVLLDEKNKALIKFLDHRLPKAKDISPEKLRSEFKDVVTKSIFDNELGKLLLEIEESYRNYILKFMNSFYNEMRKWEEENNKVYDLTDYGLRNIVFTGGYFYYEKDYHRAIKELIEIFGSRGSIVLNDQESLWLIAITENGHVLNSEASIIDNYTEEDIAEIFLVRSLLTPVEIEQIDSLGTLECKIDHIRGFAVWPSASEESLEAIRKASVLVFAPTTFYSSIAPTLITKGIPSAIRESGALKISIANLKRERGKKTVSENFEDLEKYLNFGLDYGAHSSLDYLIVNSHGYKTDKDHIPVDDDRLNNLGIETVMVNIEDAGANGKHRQSLISSIVLSLRAIDKLGYRLANGKLVKKSDFDSREAKRQQIRNLTRNPILYRDNLNRIERLCCEVLGINSPEDFVPIRPVKVVILAEGAAKRLKSDVPKVLYPIAGKANLSYLLDTFGRYDRNPLLLVNRTDEAKVKEWLANNPAYQVEIAVAVPRGTGGTLFEIKDRFADFGGDVLMVWGDISNITSKTLKHTIMIHQAVGNASLTMPTSWKKNPYAGLIRNETGDVIGVFQTKVNPEEKRRYGEHDGSVFLFDAQDVYGALGDFSRKIGFSKWQGTEELDFLKAIHFLASRGKTVLGLSFMDPRETCGFNTQEEAINVERYKNELQNGLPLKKIDIKSLLDESDRNYKKNQEKDMPIEPRLINEHSKRLTEYLNQAYEGLVIDVDETITDSDGNIPNDIVDFIVSLAAKDIPVGIITGRTNESLNTKLIARLFSYPEFSLSAKRHIFVYPEGGSYGYRLDKGEDEKLYEYNIPNFISEAALIFLRKYIFSMKDDYSFTKYKIHIWPEHPENQKAIVNRINLLFKLIGLPLKAYHSTSVTSSGSIIITLEAVHKGIALLNFTENNNIVSIDHIAKLGDMAKRGSVDYELLKGRGSFSVSEFDRSSNDQVALPIVKGLSGLEASRWLFKQL